jgi:hypothetical protein
MGQKLSLIEFTTNLLEQDEELVQNLYIESVVHAIFTVCYRRRVCISK